MRDFRADLEDWIERAELFWDEHGPRIGVELPSVLVTFALALAGGLLLTALIADLLPGHVPTLLLWLVAGYIGTEAVLFRKAWLGRRIRPRLWVWWGLALLSFGLIALLLVLSVVGDLTRFNAMLATTAALKATPATPANLAKLAGVTQDGKTTFFGSISMPSRLRPARR